MTPNDEKLISRVLSGETEAFSGLVQRYQRAVFATTLQLVRDFEVARDLAQEAFLKAFLRLSTLKHPSRFGPWLRKIARSLSQNWLRDTEKEQDGLPVHMHSNTVESPDEALNRKLLREDILAAIGRLSKVQQLTVMLYHMDGMSYGEIAHYQDVPVSTIRSRLYEARKRLKGELLTMMEDRLRTEAPDESFTRQVVGRITEVGTNAPIEGAHVQVMKIGEGISDTEGHYQVEVHETLDERIEIHVEAKGYVHRSMKALPSEELDIQLEQGTCVIGRLTDENGQPISGAILGIGLEQKAPVPTTRTDHDGTFRLEGVAIRPELQWVCLKRPDPLGGLGFAKVSINRLGIVDLGELRFSATDDYPCELRGIVRNTEGQPLGNAQVKVASHSGARIDADVRTDAQGEYRIEGIVRRTRTGQVIVVSCAGYAATIIELPERDVLDLTLGPGRTIKRRVVDPDEQPVVQARITLQLKGFYWLEPGIETVTDDDGYFSFENAPLAPTELRICADGFQPQARQWGAIAVSGDVGEIPAIVLERAGHIRGKVVDAETGEPITKFHLQTYPFPGEPHDKVVQPANGEFEVTHTFNAETYIWIFVEGYFFGFQVCQAGNGNPIQFEMQRASAIQGIVIDGRSGEPVPGAQVRPFGARNPYHIDESWITPPEIVVHTDAEGRFSVQGTDPERQFLHILHGHHAPSLFGPLALDANGHFPAIRIEMHCGGSVRIKGSPGEKVHLMRDYGDWPGHLVVGGRGFPLFSQTMETRLDADGLCEIKALLPADYFLGISRDWRCDGQTKSAATTWARITTENNQVLELEAKKSGSHCLFGTVTDADGAPVPLACVRLEGLDITTPQAQIHHNCGVCTDERGNYEMRYLLPGRYILQCPDVAVKQEIELLPGQAEMRYDIQSGE